MKITKVNNLDSPNRGSGKYKQSFAETTSSVNNNTSGAGVPAYAYKSNFMPSFGKFRKIQNISLLDKDTQKPVNASLLRDSIGDYVQFKVIVDRKEAGYLDMCVASIFPEKDFLCPESDNNIPEVSHLRSLLGDKYYGIGTELINAAIDESSKNGKNGALWLNAEQGYAHSLSRYRRYENPIPFYYKMGFRSLDEDVDSLIKKSMDQCNLALLPETAVLILSSQGAYDFKKYYSQNYNIKKSG